MAIRQPKPSRAAGYLSPYDGKRMSRAAFLQLPEVFVAEGVVECWLIDPEARTFEVITQAGGRGLGPAETLTSSAMPGFELNLAELFAVLHR